MSEPDILHEARDTLSDDVVNGHRAIRSLMEELEAIDWYAQRVDATNDQELKEVLAHNRDEEKEHAAMVLEWIRRHDPVLDRYLRQYLFTEASIVGIEEAVDAAEEPEAADDVRGGGGTARGLGIGSLRGSVR
ncbi:MAG TPA: encapsulin-associated ferritin-like protein [Gammaproteobacteria bacterium]